MLRLADNPVLTPEILGQLDLDRINFVTNERLLAIMERTGASAAQVAEAVQVNEESRLRALKFGLLLMAGVALLTIFPAGRLPNYRPGEIPAQPAPAGPEALKAAAREAEAAEVER